MNKTGIEYLTHTWNPIAMRCTPVSPACEHCWHLRMCDRMKANPVFSDERRAAYAGTGPPVLVEKELEAPLRKRKPAVIGVQFMGDLFHASVTDQMIARVWNIMASATLECQKRHEHESECWTGEPHQYLVLTKRPERARRMLTQNLPYLVSETWSGDSPISLALEVAWPLPNVWLGTTVENQEWADIRIPQLLSIPAAGHFVSLEPMLSAVDLEQYLWNDCPDCDGSGLLGRVIDPGLAYRPMSTGSWATCETCGGNSGEPGRGMVPTSDGLDWCITGGETGPGARPSHPDWFREVRDQCAEAGAAFMFKAWGAWVPVGSQTSWNYSEYVVNRENWWVAPDGSWTDDFGPWGMRRMARVGKKAAGHLLDGVEHMEFPESLGERIRVEMAQQED